MSWAIWLTLLTAALLISLSPGPGAANSMADGLSQGFKRALVGIAGLQLGYLIQILVVVLGLAAVVATSQWLFSLIKWVGVIYLSYLGLRLWFDKGQGVHIQAEKKPWNLYKSFWKGFMVDITNPKASLFLLAFIPQFVNPQANQWLQLIIIALTLIGIDLIVMIGYAALAHKLRQILQSPEKIKLQNRLAGSALMLAAAVLSFSKPQS